MASVKSGHSHSKELTNAFLSTKLFAFPYSTRDGDETSVGFQLLETLSHLFHLVQFFKRWQMFEELNSKGSIEVQEKKKKVVVLRTRPPQNKHYDEKMES